MPFINTDNSAQLKLLVQKVNYSQRSLIENISKLSYRNKSNFSPVAFDLKHFSGCVQINQLIFIHHNNNALLFC